MKRINIRKLSFLLATLMLLSAVCLSCRSNNGDVSGTNEDTDANKTESNIEETTSYEGEQTTELPIGKLDMEYGQMIEYADYLADGVEAYYGDATRSNAVIENQNMILTHGLSNSAPNLVSSITNKNGGVYINDTMDAFVKTTDGKTYFASDWMTGSSFNIYRGGYYYQEARITDQGFADGDAIIADGYDIEVSDFESTDSNQVTCHGVDEDGVFSFTVDQCSDPGVRNNKVTFSAKEYNALLLTVKTEELFWIQVFIKVGASGYSNSMSKYISVIPGDDYHTYVIRLDDLKGYKNKVTGIRFDMGKFEGETVQIKSVKAVNINENNIPVRFDRGLHAYSDKLHQELHFVTTAETDKVASYGMVTDIAADTVAKLIVKDAKGTHTTLGGVDFTTVEYVGFDIKNAGVFGYILANHEGSGTLTVALEGDRYVITQEMVLEAGAVLADKTNFYMGHRIYTDTTHSFDAFLKEAEIERNPLTEKNFDVRYVSDDPSLHSKFVGYDALRGAYRISINSTDFNTAYYQRPNQHYRAYTTVKGDDLDRRIYLYTRGTTGGLECAAVLDKNDMMLPVPLQVIKNFGNDGEESIFLHDTSYCEVYMPLMVNAGSSQTFSILNLYQNWGQFPLKQLSWIQYYAPYYHLSTGVTETNCIAPMYGANGFQMVNDVDNGVVYEFHVTSGKSLWTLPDFRAMSAQLWDSQPQHNSCATITWLEYYTADGSHYASDFVSDRIDAAGPTYADITLDYVSDDGKITASYRHAEMPQTDENRTYYSLRYDVNDTVEIENFLKDFNIIKLNSRFQIFEHIGYLDENNKSVVEKAHKSAESRIIRLGNEYPYFDFFTTLSDKTNRATNYAVIIKSWDIKLGGKAYDGSFMLEEWYSDNTNSSRLSLDIGKITLQKGDYIDIDMILLPWGMANATDDSNVLQVRQDSCIDPYKVTATVGQVIEDAYIPMIKAENNQAEFTFSGGHNNGVVRVLGFNVLTNPTVQELVDGKWVDYELSSANTPDKAGNSHYYDGYCVHYDGDGSFSYSFVIPTENGAERKFRIVAEGFEKYPELETGVLEEVTEEDEEVVLEEETKPAGEGAPTLYYSAQDVYLMTQEAYQSENSFKLLDVDLETDADSTRFARLWAEAGAPEAYVVLENDASGIASAPYFAFKYRTVTEGYHESWLNSNSAAPGGSVKEGFVNDGEWHYYVVDAATVLENYNGKDLKYFRFDFMNVNGGIGKNAYLDIAYIAFFATEGDAMRFEYGDDYKTSEELKNENNAMCVDSSSGYHISDVVYGAHFDKINGAEKGSNDTYGSRGGDSKYGVDVINFGDKTLSDGNLVIAGWSIADGGIEKYIWSADGGKTWYQIGTYTIAGVGNGAGTAHQNVVRKSIGAYQFAAGTEKNSTYQFNDGVGGIAINLSAYKGQTVDVVLAAVPSKDTRGLCLLALFKDVEVIGSSTAPDADELLPDSTEEETEDNRTAEEKKAENNKGCIDPSSGYSESSLVYGCSLDMINGMGEGGAKNFGGRGGNSVTGVDNFYYEIRTVKGSNLVFTGWTVVDGGIVKYVWSADGGKTWNDAVGYNCDGPGNGAGTAHYNVVIKSVGSYTFSENSPMNSTYGGAAGAGESVSGLAADLSDYAGKTVEVIFAAVPVKEPDKLCLIARVTNVTVLE
ncbi:MAG: hypothetical protein IJY39_09215 [Clostridia bacterium]|nr:hypothetical protein [Clostridia bacterium]